MIHFNKILHPTDFSSHAESARRFAFDLAEKYGAELIVLAVSEFPLTYSEIPPAPGLFEETRDEDESRLEKYCAHSPAGIRLTRRTELGAASEKILEVAGQERCDLIVMGTHGRRGLSRVLIGSVAEQVIRRADCPVLILRAEPKEV
jgi:nucleotide-binding universal stress UspA family protein